MSRADSFLQSFNLLSQSTPALPLPPHLAPTSGLLLSSAAGLRGLLLDLLDDLLSLFDGVLRAEAGLGEQALAEKDKPSRAD